MDGREVTIRPLTPEDGDIIFTMFTAMSDEALRWGNPPYTRKRIETWMSNMENHIILGAEHGKHLVSYVHVEKETYPRRKGIAELSIYLHVRAR